MIKCLKELEIKFDELILWASPRSAWKKIETIFWDKILQEVNEWFFEELDFCLFSAWWDNSRQFIPIAAAKGVVCIDNSSAYRYDENVPLVIPQINFDSVGNSKIIANPNCTTAIAAVVLYPIYKKYGIKKIIMSTYQATSWAWAKWMNELLENTKAYFKWEEPVIENFIENIAFNVIPHIDTFQENWYTKEEMKVVWETHKIFWDTSIDISCTCVRIPTLRAHSESIVLETQQDVNIGEIKELLLNASGVKLVDDIENNEYPMPINASWNNDVEVWRIRKNLVFWDKWLELFVSWDQLLRWAALNAVEILKECVNKVVYWF